MDATAVDPLVGRVLDRRYRIDSRIARGGMATVYVSHDLKLDRTVALKVMHPNLAQDDDFVRRFIHEAKSAAALSHPNIVSVFDQGTDGANVFLAMEYVPGRTLRDVLTQRGRVGPREALELMQPVLAALAVAHRAGLVHRDVKPENVLVMEDGRIKVTDFGLARAESASKQTKTGVLLGTVGYLAPEQVLSGTADARADVYAAGIMLFELLAGRQPYEGDTPLAVAFIVWAAWYQTSGQYDKIPKSVIGMSMTDAKAKLETAGLTVKTGKGSYDAKVPKDHVLRVSPEPGSRFKAGDTVTLYPSRGRFPIEVPDVTGKTLDQAKAELQATGLTPGVVERDYSDNVAKDMVVRTDPEAHEKQQPEEPVTIVLSNGIKLEDLVGWKREDAENWLRQRGLNPQIQEQDDRNKDANTVLAMSPPAGAGVSQGDTITLQVNKKDCVIFGFFCDDGGGNGNPPNPQDVIPVPPVVGQPVHDAAQALQNAGFKVEVKRET